MIESVREGLIDKPTQPLKINGYNRCLSKKLLRILRPLHGDKGVSHAERILLPSILINEYNLRERLLGIRRAFVDHQEVLHVRYRKTPQ